jgi:uncharacterized membrane protein YphA (DoxX/SURF4 family)
MNPRRVVKIVTALLISAGLGLVFLYSGYSKLYPLIEPFEFTFVDIGVADWYTAPIIARLLIGLEFFIGLLLILGYRLKKFTIPFTIGLLLFFIIYLIISITINGNKGNCGCFGEHLKMTPLQAIIKNAIMIVAALLVYFLWDGWKVKSEAKEKLFNRLFSFGTLVLVTIVPFVFNPIDYTYSSNNLGEKVNYPLDLKLLYKPEDTSKVKVPSVDLRKGKHVIAFMSLTCPHCRVAAKKFRVIKKNNPDIPIYFEMNGDPEKYKLFIDDTHADNIPWSLCNGKTFVNLAATSLPQIYYLDNGVVVKKVDYYELNQYKIEEWLKTGNPK